MLKQKNTVGKKYLFQTVTFIVTISVLPLFVIGIFSYHNITREVNQEIRTNNRRVVSLTLNNVESIFDQLKASCRILSENRAFFDFHALPMPVSWYESKTSFEVEEDLHAIYQYVSLKGNIFDKLSSFKMSMDFIHSIYFIDIHKDIVMTSDRESPTLNHFYDSGLLELLERQNSSMGILSRELIDSQGNAVPVISFYQGARSLGESQIYVVNIASNDLYSYIYKHIMENTNDKLIVLQDKNVVLPSSPDAGDLAGNINFPQNSGNVESLQYETKYRETSYSITGIYSSKLFWWFISVNETEEIFKTEKYILRTILFISLYMAAVIFGCVLLWSIRWYRPIKKIMSFIRESGRDEISGSENSRHELLFIGEHLKQIVIEGQKLQERVALMLPSYRDRYLYSLLTGEQLADESLEACLADMNVNIVSENLVVCIFHLGVESRGNGNGVALGIPESIEIADILSEFLREYVPQSVCLTETAGRYICIINLKQADKSKLFHMADAVRGSLRFGYKVDCYTGISRIYDDISSLPECYREAEHALSHSILFTDQSIVHIEELSPGPMVRRKTPPNLPKELLASIRAGEEDSAIMALLASFKEITLSTDTYSFGETAIIFQRIVAKLFDLCEEMGCNSDEVYELLLVVGQDLQGRNELLALEKLKRAIILMARYCQKTQTPKNEDHIAVAIAYIHNNYGNSALSLSMLADTIGLNPDYLGRLFKERTGKSFVEYLTGYRIDKSAEMLTVTKEKIKDISIASGYVNVNYFIKVFREIMGVTPKVYRDRETKNIKNP